MKTIFIIMISCLLLGIGLLIFSCFKVFSREEERRIEDFKKTQEKQKNINAFTEIENSQTVSDFGKAPLELLNSIRALEDKIEDLKGEIEGEKRKYFALKEGYEAIKDKYKILLHKHIKTTKQLTNIKKEIQKYNEENDKSV